MAGDGPLLADLKSMANELGLAEKVNFLGFRADVVNCLNALDVFVMSSHHEGVPTVLLEAMGLGKPVVATAVGGIVEVLEGGRFGRTVPPGDPQALSDALLALLQNREIRLKLGREGRERIRQEFSAHLMGERVLDLYKEMMGQR